MTEIQRFSSESGYQATVEAFTTSLTPTNYSTHNFVLTSNDDLAVFQYGLGASVVMVELSRSSGYKTVLANWVIPVRGSNVTRSDFDFWLTKLDGGFPSLLCSAIYFTITEGSCILASACFASLSVQ